MFYSIFTIRFNLVRKFNIVEITWFEDYNFKINV